MAKLGTTSFTLYGIYTGIRNDIMELGCAMGVPSERAEEYVNIQSAEYLRAEYRYLKEKDILILARKIIDSFNKEYGLKIRKNGRVIKASWEDIPKKLSYNKYVSKKYVSEEELLDEEAYVEEYGEECLSDGLYR